MNLYNYDDRRKFADKGRRALEALEKLGDTVEVTPAAASAHAAVARAWIELAKL